MARQLFVFGSNGEGQLGIPAADIVDSPVKVPNPPPLENLQSIVGGYNHTLICTSDSQVYGSGDNRKGQLSGYSCDSTPTLGTFKPVHADVAHAAGTCESSAFFKLSKRNELNTEGAGVLGELGRGDDIQKTTDRLDLLQEAPITLPLPAVDLAAGVWHYVAVLEDGSAYGWGKARLGQLGATTSPKITEPTKINDIPFKVVRVVCGKDFTYLVGNPSTGEHIVLGKDKFGISSNKPPSIKGWKDIGATWHSIFVLFEDGTLRAWGRNTMWELLPPNLPPLDKIAVGSEHILALTTEGKLISWGWGKHGNCGNLDVVRDQAKNDMISGFWNEIDLPGRIEMISSGYCTSFVVTKVEV